MLPLAIVAGWLLTGCFGVWLNIACAPLDDMPYQEYSPNEPDQFFMGLAMLLGPFGLLLAALKYASAVTIRARKNKARIAAEMEKDLAAARAEIDALLRKQAQP